MKKVEDPFKIYPNRNNILKALTLSLRYVLHVSTTYKKTRQTYKQDVLKVRFFLYKENEIHSYILHITYMFTYHYNSTLWYQLLYQRHDLQQAWLINIFELFFSFLRFSSFVLFVFFNFYFLKIPWSYWIIYSFRLPLVLRILPVSITI